MAKINANYEAVYILQPDLSEEQIAALVERFKSVVEANGTVTEVEYDNVVNAIGFLPTPVAKKGKNVHLVGDCIAIGNLRTVIWRAWDVCMKI